MAFKKLGFIVPLKSHLESIIPIRYYCIKQNKILETAEENPVYLEEEQDVLELEKKRNKSRLNTAHRNILHGQKPYAESCAWYHDTIRYKKRILGRYGMQALDVPAGVAWPTLEEVEDKKEFERVAFPLSIQDRLQKIKKEKQRKEEALRARQKEIAAKMVNMKKMIADVQMKIAKRQAEEEEAKLIKERKIEMIRQELIAQGNMTKEKLEQALTVAAKVEKKKKKEAKKAKLLERQMQMIQNEAETKAIENADIAEEQNIEQNNK